MQVEQRFAQREEAAVTKGWAPATHESMNSVFVHPTLGPYEFSEVTYYFGKELHEKLRIELGALVDGQPGVHLEVKPAGIAVHVRQASAEVARRVAAARALHLGRSALLGWCLPGVLTFLSAAASAQAAAAAASL